MTRNASGGADGDIAFWDAEHGRILTRLGERIAFGRHVAFSPAGELVVTSAGRGKTQVWKLNTK